jgi:chemotaxis regulatin CheY-phosphate phosphatase CheZ
MEDKRSESYRRQVEEAERTIKQEWPDWMRRNRDAVHVPVNHEEVDPDLTADVEHDKTLT